MSKRHHTSRRKAYGRRQHEVRERHDRGQHADASALDLDAVGLRRSRRPAVVPRSAHAAVPLRAGRLIDGRLRGRTPPHHRAARDARGSSSRRCCPVGVPALRSAPIGRPGLGPASILGLIVVAFMLAFFSLAQQVRVSATSYDIGRLQVERERLDARLQEIDVGSEPARSRAGRPQARTRRRPRPAGRDRPASGPLIVGADERCWVAPIPAAASSSC